MQIHVVTVFQTDASLFTVNITAVYVTITVSREWSPMQCMVEPFQVCDKWKTAYVRFTATLRGQTYFTYNHAKQKHSIQPSRQTSKSSPDRHITICMTAWQCRRKTEPHSKYTLYAERRIICNNLWCISRIAHSRVGVLTSYCRSFE